MSYDKVKYGAVWIVVFTIQLSLFVSQARAQQLTGRAPSQVAIGEQFRLSDTVNTDDVKGFRAGNIPDAFDVLMGPSTSTQSSYQLVNGHMSSSSSVTYTYILSATKNGSFTIPAAQAQVGSKTIHSNEIHIKVSGQAQSNGQQGRQQSRAGEEVRPAGSAISGSDLFIKVTASKQRVREQEPILLTYKVYTLVGLTQLNGKMADLKSFIPVKSRCHRRRPSRLSLLTDASIARCPGNSTSCSRRLRVSWKFPVSPMKDLLYSRIAMLIRSKPSLMVAPVISRSRSKSKLPAFLFRLTRFLSVQLVSRAVSVSLISQPLSTMRK